MAIGEGLLSSFEPVLAEVPEANSGPQKLAGALGIDKVLASRLLKMMRSYDAMTAVHRAPGPDPLRRALKAAERVGVDPALIGAAEESVDALEKLIRVELGDRSVLGTILSAWVPEARSEFETRRKQSVHRAMSQIQGVEVDVCDKTVVYWPSEDGLHLDSAILRMVHGLRRLRPGVTVHYSSMYPETMSGASRPANLAGEPIDSVSGAIVPEFSTSPVPEITARVAGDGTTHYLLDETSLGISTAIDLVSCEIVRPMAPRYRPRSHNRRTWSSMAINLPTKVSQFDFLVHEDVFPGEAPDLRLYDTVIRGNADVNDPARDIDRLDLLADIETLGTGVRRFGSSDVPRYQKTITHVMDRLGLDGSKFRGYRVSCEFPIYGSQFAMSFKTTDPPPGVTV